jgi:cellulose synthase/poly-beta-1,6-N-acetylglucosamine synthase-like glycosyltransferase
MLQSAIAHLFYAIFLLLFYTHIGYPCLVLMLSRIYQRPICYDPRYLPKVSLIIPVYNEAAIIKEKIANSLALDYPKDKLQIIIASDGSTDETNAIISENAAAGILFLDFPQRRGKAHTLNDAFQKAEGEIIVFSDASGILNREAIRELCMPLADPSVGCSLGTYQVAGRLKTTMDSATGSYLDWELKLKRAESKIFTTLGGHGYLYALRKSLFRPLQPEWINDDYLVPAFVSLEGRRAVYARNAHAVDHIQTTVTQEFRRRLRIGYGNWQQVAVLSRCLNVTTHPFLTIQFLSHKFLRTLASFLLLALAILSFFVGEPMALFMRLSFLTTLALALWGLLESGRRHIQSDLASVWLLIYLGNLAYMYAGLNYFLRRKSPHW